MKKSTYDAVSTIAIVSLVVFTVAAQHSSHAGYAFGVLAVLSAAGLLAAYIKSLRKPASKDQTAQNIEAAKQQENAAQSAAMARHVRADFYRKLFLAQRERESRVHDALNKERLIERQISLFFGDIEHGEIKAGNYYTHVRLHRDLFQDTASIIVNIVEKLCAGSKEPRFEFILGLDGSFKIQQISPKRAAFVEPVSPHAEPAESSTEPGEPQVFN